MRIRHLPPELESTLQELGFTRTEIVIYLMLLKVGPTTILNLSKASGIKRSTTHNYVEELIKKGLISQSNHGERRIIKAEDPERISFLIERKLWELRKTEANLPRIIEIINALILKEI